MDGADAVRLKLWLQSRSAGEGYGNPTAPEAKAAETKAADPSAPSQEAAQAKPEGEQVAA